MKIIDIRSWMIPIRKYFALKLRNLVKGLSIGISVILFSNTSIFATGSYLPAYNARYGGMGGVNLAIGGSPLDAYLNPANLTQSANPKLEFGELGAMVQTRYQDLHISQDPNRNYSNDKTNNVVLPPPPIPYIAFTLPISERLFYGISGNVSQIPGSSIGSMQSRINGLLRSVPGGNTVNNWSELDLPSPIGNSSLVRETRLTQAYEYTITNAFAYKLGDFSFGLGFQVNLTQLTSEVIYKDPSESIELKQNGTKFKSDIGISYSGNLGITYDITERWKVAYAYQSPFRFSLDGKIKVGTIPFDLPVSGSMYFSDKHGFGFSYRVDAIKIGVDLNYYNFGRYSNNQEVSIGAPVYRSQSTNLNYHNAWSAAIGAEFIPDKIAYRVGYSYNNPVIRPDGSGAGTTGTLIGTDTVTFGNGFYMDKWIFDYNLEYTLPRKITASPSADWYLNRVNDDLSDNQNYLPYYRSSTELKYLIGFAIGATYKFE